MLSGAFFVYIYSMLALYGLIGFPLTHSFSPAYFKMKFAAQHLDAVYELFPIKAIREFPELLKNNPDLAGLNVTTPYKEAIIRYIDDLDKVAEEIGAVNCLAFNDGKLKGYNTDAVAFEKSLNPLLKSQHTQALILGTGGSSKAVAYTLTQLGIPYRKVSRDKTDEVFTYAELSNEIIAHYKLIINTTPVGMYPNVDDVPPISFRSIGENHLVYDLIYNPEETKFLSLAKARGAVVKNGFEMLQLQAEASWEIWNHGSETEDPD